MAQPSFDPMALTERRRGTRRAVCLRRLAKICLPVVLLAPSSACDVSTVAKTTSEKQVKQATVAPVSVADATSTPGVTKDAGKVSAEKTNPREQVVAASNASPVVAPAVPPVIPSAVPSGVTSGVYRLVMKFDPGVKVTTRGKDDGGPDQLPDGSLASLLELTVENGEITKCVQMSLSRVSLAQQPVCSREADGIKLVLSDGNAAFGARMETVVQPSAEANYQGLLMLRAVIIPNGKAIGQVTLSRL